ncbi:hypothetical protein DVH24_034532 [Malus domestica]|uniref:Uncharacterized protein n=1 Tax=Malus domestica TaxID=3750 RepID=A0A498J101_MALDO|nr:hypothetical protein DVH24_034532 [Malus domestica]
MASNPLLPLLFLLTLFKFSAQIAPQAADQTLKTFIFRVDRHSKPSIFPTHYHWYASEFADPPQILHVYDTVFHGFSASLTPDQKPAPENLNYPSIGAVFSRAGKSSKMFIRSVTNVGQPNAVYGSRIEAPKGVTVSVKPSRLVFSGAVKKRSFVVTVAVDRRNVVFGESGAAFGSLYWSDGKHVVRSPIVVTQMDPL